MRDTLLANVRCDHAVQSLMRVIAQREVVAEDIEHAHHLTENENAMSILAKAGEQFIEQNHLPAVHDEALKLLVLRRVAIFSAVEQVRVVGRLFQLHCCVTSEVNVVHTVSVSMLTDVKEADVVVPIRTLHEALEVLANASANNTRRYDPTHTYLRQDVLVKMGL